MMVSQDNGRAWKAEKDYVSFWVYVYSFGKQVKLKFNK